MLRTTQPITHHRQSIITPITYTQVIITLKEGSSHNTTHQGDHDGEGRRSSGGDDEDGNGGVTVAAAHGERPGGGSLVSSSPVFLQG